MADAKAIMQYCWDAFSTGDASKATDYIAEESVDHQSLPGLDTNGPEGFRRVVALFRGAFPDMRGTIEHTVAEGDLVVAYGRMKGTNTGEFMGMPATGRAIDIETFDMLRIANGKAVEHWGVTDVEKMMEQLGLLPSPGA